MPWLFLLGLFLPLALGSGMAKVITLYTAAQKDAGKALQQAPHTALPNDVLVQQLVDTLIELQRRSNMVGFATIALMDATGRVWAMRALVQLCQNYFTHIALRAER